MTNTSNRFTTIFADDLTLINIGDVIMVKGHAGALLGFGPIRQPSLSAAYVLLSNGQGEPRMYEIGDSDPITVLDAETQRSPINHWGGN
jgi:hypothetical protein